MPPQQQAASTRPLPKFGEWDVNNPESAEGFTVIFNKARDQKKTSGSAVGGGGNGVPGENKSYASSVDNGSKKDKKPNQPKRFLGCFYGA